MIPSYLQSLAATVRDLVASGKAVHVTNETAAELDLLAGLPWQDADPARVPVGQQTHAILGSCDVFKHIPITPADLALGWLLASRAMTRDVKSNFGDIERNIADAEDVKRAAECAELAMLGAVCLVLQPQPRGDELGAMLMPHGSTRDGARAAWAFVVERLTRSAESIEENTRKPDDNVDRHVGRRLLCAERYRRELEAMG